MVLGDITNLASSRGQLGEQKAERLRILEDELPLIDGSELLVTERIAPRPGYDPAEKAARANALWDQKQRIEALMEELLPKRLRAKELRRALSEVEQRSAARAAELNSQKEESELQMFKLHEGSAEISSQLAALSAQLLAEEETHRRLQVGVQAKAAAEATAESQRLRAVELCASAAAATWLSFDILVGRILYHFAQAQWTRILRKVLAQNVPRARALHNGLMNLKGSPSRVDCLDEQRLTVRSEVVKSVTGFLNEIDCDHVFAPRSSQAEVFEALDGYRVAIFAYGQTGGFQVMDLLIYGYFLCAIVDMLVRA
ncbi:Kinesin-like protein 1 [Symbiodinium microadriaticum]|uniref:Kinesin-like protein 1 n=1 Tax=Symbiodinium microadriaticum TaxID=2951 RepID=A0A1Q9CMI0_SYMMI|nr:Kinesin-like protein 1 [Symbiodinium microadriaticum]